MFPALVALTIALAGWSCSDRAANSGSSVEGNVELRARLSGGAGAEQIDLFRLIVTGPQMDRIETLLEFDGRYITGEVLVPVGRDRRFVLQAEEIQVSPVGGDEDTVVVYRGVTVSAVEPEVVLTLEIDLAPVVPTLKFTPRWITAPSGELFTLDIMAYNMTTLPGLRVVLDYDYTLLQPAGAIPIDDLGEHEYFHAEEVDDAMAFEIVRADTSGASIVDSDGNGAIARLFFTAEAFTGDEIVTEITFGDIELIEVDTSYPPSADLHVETAEITLTPRTDVAVVFPDSGLRAAIWDALGMDGGETIMLDTLLTLEYFSVGDEYSFSDLTGMEYMVNLEGLSMAYNGTLSDLTPLAALHRLEWLTLEGEHITDILPLSGLIGLRTLDLYYNEIVDIGPLADMTMLYELNLRHNNITDINVLAGLRGLWYLVLDDNEIDNISPVAGLTDLWQLSLYQNQVSDLTPLTGVTSLGELDVSYNQVTDIYPLVQNAGLDSGDVVDVTGNSLDDEQQQDYMRQLRDRGVTVYYGYKSVREKLSRVDRMKATITTGCSTIQ